MLYSIITFGIKKMKNEYFEAKSMLIISSRKQILPYKQLIEEFILQYPKEQQYDVVCAFTPFTLDKKNYSENNQEINKDYSEDPVKEFLNNTKVRLIIVVDKLQTGFDAPQLGIMYIDKTLKGGNAVQTLGRLSRSAKGKKEVAVVDFVNTKKNIFSIFEHYFNSESQTDNYSSDSSNENNIIKSLIQEIIGNDFTVDNLEFAKNIWQKKKKIPTPKSPIPTPSNKLNPDWKSIAPYEVEKKNLKVKKLVDQLSLARKKIECMTNPLINGEKPSVIKALLLLGDVMLL